MVFKQCLHKRCRPPGDIWPIRRECLLEALAGWKLPRGNAACRYKSKKHAVLGPTTAQCLWRQGVTRCLLRIAVTHCLCEEAGHT